MSTKEKIKQELDELSEPELQKVSELISLLMEKKSRRTKLLKLRDFEGNLITPIFGILLINDLLLLDTNILVYLQDQSSAFYQRATQFIEDHDADMFIHYL